MALQLLQDLTGISLSAFLLLHIASPLAAGLTSPSNSESAASNLQLATRVVYQDGPSRELLLVWIPLGTHVLVGIVRRITRIERRRRILAQLQRRARMAEPEQSTIRWAEPSLSDSIMGYLPTSYHAIAAYLGIPLLLDHVYHHRIAATPPERTFQWVTFALNQSPILNIVKYTALVSTLVYHSLVGFHHIQARFFNRSNKDRDLNQASSESFLDSQRSLSVRLAWLGVVGTVGLGIRNLAHHQIPPWIARRYIFH